MITVGYSPTLADISAVPVGRLRAGGSADPVVALAILREGEPASCPNCSGSAVRVPVGRPTNDVKPLASRGGGSA